MPKAKELTTTQAAFLADYRKFLTAAAELEADRLQAYRDLYTAGSLAVSAGVTYSRGAKEAGVSVGTFAKHVFAYPLMPTIEGWVQACEVMGLDPATLPHVLVGRAVDAGVSTEVLRSIGDAVGRSIDEEGMEPSLAITTAVKALDRAAAAARKAKRDADAANNGDESGDESEDESGDESEDESGDESEDESGDESGDDEVTRQISASRPMIRKAAQLLAAGADLPELAEWQGWKADVRALLDIVKALDEAARKSA